jgi:hypothetical protein
MHEFMNKLKILKFKSKIKIATNATKLNKVVRFKKISWRPCSVDLNK